LSFAGFRPGPTAQQQFKFFFPPNEGSQAGCVQRLKAALNRACPHRRPRPYRLGDAFYLIGPEVLQLEQVAEQLSGALGNNDRVRIGDRLQACREVRGLADDRLLLSRTRPDQIADHD
jgi:hypothetical protein